MGYMLIGNESARKEKLSLVFAIVTAIVRDFRAAAIAFSPNGAITS